MDCDSGEARKYSCMSVKTIRGPKVQGVLFGCSISQAKGQRNTVMYFCDITGVVCSGFLFDFWVGYCKIHLSNLRKRMSEYVGINYRCS